EIQEKAESSYNKKEFFETIFKNSKYKNEETELSYLLTDTQTPEAKIKRAKDLIQSGSKLMYLTESIVIENKGKLLKCQLNSKNITDLSLFSNTYFRPTLI